VNSDSEVFQGRTDFCSGLGGCIQLFAQRLESCIRSWVVAGPVPMPLIVPTQYAPAMIREFGDESILAWRQTRNAVLEDPLGVKSKTVCGSCYRNLGQHSKQATVREGQIRSL
jgi:hypothetical protein